MIPYDPTKESLFKPYKRPTTFTSPETSITHWACAELTRLIYLPFESDQHYRQRLVSDLSIGGFELLTVFSNEGTQAILVRHISSMQHALVFRGTELILKDWFINALFYKKNWPNGGRVHAGFAKALEVIWSDIEASTQNVQSIIFTGHSLGAALATLAASKLHSKCKQLVTIGSPRVGNSGFAKSMTSIDSVRYVDSCDLVTKIPPSFLGYEHINGENYFDKEGCLMSPTTNERKIDQDLGKKSYSKQYAAKPENVKIRGLADHSPINYVRIL